MLTVDAVMDPPSIDLLPWPRTWVSHANAAIGHTHVVHVALCNRGEAPLRYVEIAEAPTLGAQQGSVSFPGALYPFVVGRVLDAGATLALTASFPGDGGHPPWSTTTLTLVVCCAGSCETTTASIRIPLP